MINVVMYTGHWFCRGIVIQESTMNALYSSNGREGEYKKCIRNFGGETYVKVASWKGGKETG
jgi:hypothetical protein